MGSEISIFAIATAVITFAVATVYRRVWTRVVRPPVTPTGFGVFLAVVLLLAARLFDAPGRVLASTAVLAAATAVYWLDDVAGLSARLRMAISFATGVAICAFMLGDRPDLPLAVLIGAAAAAGALNVVLTNIVNFYDGADLNLATFIVLTAAMILWFVPADHFLAVGAVAALAFVLPFAVVNSRPKTLYLGDAASFAFASFLTLIAVTYFGEGGVSARVAVPLALPAVDTFYVFVVRVVEKHDLMTRNYLHLYQKLNHHYRGFGYLLPQAVNAALLLACAAAVQAAGASELVAVATAMVGVSVPFYFACRRAFVPRTDDAGSVA